jgi:hypothetical protein
LAGEGQQVRGKGCEWEGAMQMNWGRAAATGEYDLGWFQKRAQFCGYNDVFGGKKKVIGI